MSSKRRTVSREELYQMVWETPMARLAGEFGISGNGLAKICKRLNVPYPPRGYWAKKAAGQKVAQYRLPEQRDDTPAQAVITPTPPRPKQPAAVKASIEQATAKVAAIPTAQHDGTPHRIVKAWIAAHEKNQKERAREIRSQRKGDWFWRNDPIPDLTERDLYRLDTTSLYLFALEAAGAKIIEDNFTGRFKLRIDGEELEFAIMEKMRKGIGAARGEAAKWTAYPQHHQTGLHSSGFLRFAIPTYLGEGRHHTEWVETKTQTARDLLSVITAEVIAAGTTLRLSREQSRLEQIERERRAEEAMERQRRRDIDTARWKRFCETADAWEECRRLASFLARVKAKLQTGDAHDVDGQPIADWVAWAEEKLSRHDPERWSVSQIINHVRAAESDVPKRYLSSFY